MTNRSDQLRAAVFGLWTITQQGWLKLRLAFVLVTGAILLSSCAIGPNGQLLSKKQVEELIPLHAVPVGNAWISTPDAELVFQRDLGFGAEQRISLRNQTVVPGDNLIVLRTRSGLRPSAVLRFEEFMHRVGDVPFPFENITPGELVTTSDELGSYLWAEERFAADTICVFGIRRVNSSMRQIPNGDEVMDVMLRNCVVGNAEEGLRPIIAQSVGSPALARSGDNESRLISPLAAPTMQ